MESKDPRIDIRHISKGKGCKILHFFCTFKEVGTAAKTFLTCVDSTGNSGYNEEIFSLVTSIYSNMDKKGKVLKFKEFISLNNTATLAKPQTANSLWSSDKSCQSPLACLIKAANPVRSVV